MMVKQIKKHEADLFRNFLFDRLTNEVKSNKNALALGAYFQDIPCGVLFAQLDGDICEIKNFFISPFFRNRGMGTELIDKLKSIASSKGCKKIVFQIITSKKQIEQLKSFLLKSGFENFNLLTTVYRFSSNNLLKKSRFARSAEKGLFTLPDGIKIVSYKDVSEDMLDNVKRKKGISYPDNLSPFANEFGLKEGHSFFAVLNDKEIIGWNTGFEAPGNIILYRSFFVRSDYRKSAVGYFLFNVAIKDHLNNFPEKDGLYAVAVDNTKVDKFFSLYFKDSYDHKKYEFKMEFCL